MVLIYLLGVLVLGFSLWFLKRTLRQKRRRQCRQRPLPDYWHEILERNVGLYRSLPKDLKLQLHGHMHVFLDEKQFIGCEGMKITDEVRITIAANACLLLLNQQEHYYPSLRSIYIYPNDYQSIVRQHNGLVETQTPVRVQGESWDRGPIVLSWDDAKRGAYDSKDGKNVVLHEFAHQLDSLDGEVDGAPPLYFRSRYQQWAGVMLKAYKKHVKRVAKRRKTVMDAYGATKPAEFFAVLTETFFEKPDQLQRKHPELYEEMRQFTKLDPQDWRVEDE